MDPGRTPTVHRCPKGNAVGGPQQTTSDERPDNDMLRTNVLAGKQVKTDVLSAKTGVDRHLYTYRFRLKVLAPRTQYYGTSGTVASL